MMSDLNSLIMKKVSSQLEANQVSGLVNFASAFMFMINLIEDEIVNFC